MLLFVTILFMFCPQKDSSDVPVPCLGLGRCYSWHRIRFLLFVTLNFTYFAKSIQVTVDGLNISLQLCRKYINIKTSYLCHSWRICLTLKFLPALCE